MDWLLSWPFIATVGVAVVLCVVFAAVWPAVRLRLRRREAARALRAFRLQRELLEAKFFELAGAQGRPRGLRWLECDWQNPVTFARDVRSGQLTAFAAVNIRFEAVEGGDMEGVEAVGTIREAAAVFHYRQGRWGTGGRALFNMNPRDALTRLQGQFEPVEADSTSAPIA